MIINNVNALVLTILAARSKFDSCWWRGQALSTWQLVPKVYRCNRDRNYEIGTSSHFVRLAPARYPDCPRHELDWLTLMQHYGAPTRLLDWTESPLIALFFALSLHEPDYRHDSEPAALWALDPVGLNDAQIGGRGFPSYDSPFLTDLAKAAFHTTDFDMTGTTEGLCEAQAFYPQQIDVRMVVQQSAYTIHGTEKPLQELADADEFLLKIEIPSDQKSILRHLLAVLSIRRWDLYPDLQNLGQDLSRAAFWPVSTNITSSSG